MKLNAVNVVLPVFQCHNLPFGTDGCNGKRCRQSFRIHYPRMVAPHRYFLRQSPENVIRFCQPYIGLYAVKHLAEIDQSPAEYLSDSLLSQAHSQYRFLSG